MKGALLTMVAVVLLLHQINGDPLEEDYASQPCQTRAPTYKYTNFANRHILRARFNRNSKAAWASYLERMRLCARTNVQSFIDEDEGQVKQVCRGAGYRVTTGGNLCISQSNMKVYDVESEGTNIDCTVSRVTKGVHKVVLACDKVNNNCAPVHYQNRRGYQASRQVCS